MQSRRHFIVSAVALLALPQQALAQNDLAARLFSYTNQVRARNRRADFRKSAALGRAAQDYARVMARTGQFSHTIGGTTPSQRAGKAGFRSGYVGENIGMRFGRESAQARAQAFMSQWMNSAPHRKNILNPKFRALGVGVSTARDGKVYAVQVFGGDA